MAGTIFGLGLMQQFSETNEVLAGCKLYIYNENTSTPTTAYSDFGLTSGLELSNPLVADAAGRIPAFWLADGAYRVRLTDADGNEIFDESSITAIGASSGTGGSGASVDSNAIFNTGDFLWQPVSGTKSGWVRANGRTIGSVASGATERANADTEDLFTHLWNNYSDTLCPVSGGRGASAAADFSANKAIGTLDMRNKLAFGLDDMGNSAVGLSGGTTAAAAAVGASTYTIAQANLPNVNLSSSALTITDTRTFSVGSTADESASAGADDSVASTQDLTLDMSSPASGTISIGGTVPLGGSGSQMTILGPGRAGSWYIRL